jgi:hypothetical protein
MFPGLRRWFDQRWNALSILHDRCMAVVFIPMALLAQVDDGSAKKLTPKENTNLQLSLVLAMLGLTVLVVGSFLLLWLLSRYLRRTFIDEPDVNRNSPFAQFGYKYYDLKNRSFDEDDD